LDGDATLPAISAINAIKMTRDATQIEQLNAETALIQIQISSTNVTRLIQNTLNASHVTRIRLTATQEPRNATSALHQRSSSHVMKRHRVVSQPNMEMSNRPVTQVVDPSPHLSS